MEDIKQQLSGSKNIQVGINNGNIIHTDRIINKTNVIYDPTTHISPAQAQQPKEKVAEVAKVKAMAEPDNPAPYAKIYNALYRHFGIQKYDVLPKERFNEAIQWLSKQTAFRYRPKLRKTNNDEFRKQLYKSIHAKATELGWDGDTLHRAAETILNLKQSLSSLKELSDTRLKKLYDYLFSKH